MSRFEKFKAKNGDSNWYLILDNYIDIIKYLEIDADLIIQETLCVQSQKTNKGYVMHANTVMAKVAHGINELVEISGKPLTKILPNILDSKTKGMFRILEEGDSVCINYNRGYSGLKGMCEIWDFESLQILPASHPFSFPINDSVKPPQSKHLIIENAAKISENIKKVFGLEKENDLGVITSLKEHSQEYLFEAINYAKSIYFRTMALDDIQNSQMINFFLSIKDKKNIVIDPQGHLTIQTITNLKSFDELSKQHNIKFINK